MRPDGVQQSDSVKAVVGRTAAILFTIGAFVLGAVIATVIAFVLPNSGGSTSATVTVTSTVPVQRPVAPAPVGVPAAPASGAVGIGQPLVEGDLQFIVNGVRRAPSIPDPYTPETPQNGEFFIVDMTVANVGVQQAEYRSQYQQLIVDGQMLSYADMATYKETDEQIKVQLNPGIRINTSVVYDLPVGVQPDQLEVHEDGFSTGGYINLR